PVAFAGAQHGKLEMLFVDPGARKRGIGGALLAYGIETWNVHRLDVNEQNTQACEFYEHEGFAVVARSSADSAGRPFPLLHLGRAKGARAEMRSGDWFDAHAPELAVDRDSARLVFRCFNNDSSLSEGEQTDLLRDLFGAWGLDSIVSDGVKADYGYNIFIGKGCFFNYNCTFLDGAPIIFGDDVWVGPGCIFATPIHPLIGQERARQFDADSTPHLWERNLPIVVGDDVWLASGVTVNPGVTIGEGAVIGSGSVVTKDVPPHTLAFGNPCRAVREVTESDRIF
ncbi:MAG: GNAT family N-acetyltransferase, partial [Raoultibacter sp.]